MDDMAANVTHRSVATINTTLQLLGIHININKIVLKCMRWLYIFLKEKKMAMHKHIFYHKIYIIN